MRNRRDMKTWKDGRTSRLFVKGLRDRVRVRMRNRRDMKTWKDGRTSRLIEKGLDAEEKGE